MDGVDDVRSTKLSDAFLSDGPNLLLSLACVSSQTVLAHVVRLGESVVLLVLSSVS